MQNIEKATDNLARAGDVFYVPLDRIEPSPFQAREWFDPEKLRELANDIEASHGVLQPILLRPHPTREGWFQLVAGERRWRATGLTILDTIRATVRDIDDLEASRLGLSENIQNESLTDLEEAKGVWKFIGQSDELGEDSSKTAIARKLGKSWTFVDNIYKLLDLPDEFLDIARRKRGVKSSLFAILEVKEPERQTQYLAQVEGGASVRAIQKAIAADDAEIAITKATNKAPDAQTESRTRAVAQGKTGSVSRGQQLTGGTSHAEAREQCTRGFRILSDYIPHLSDADFEKYVAPFARRILRGDLARR